MAFPTINAQQELNNRKILEDLQLKKQLLQKSGVTPVVTSISLLPSINTNSFVQSSQVSDSTVNSPARVAWNQANSLSFGYFVPQDSHLGNNILPVLPRFDNLPK